MDDKLLIKVEVVNRTYPIRIKRSDTKSEEIIRQAARNVDQAVKRFQSLGMKEKDEQDFLAMAAIQIAIKAVEAERQSDMEPLLTELKDLNFQLSSYLEEE